MELLTQSPSCTRIKPESSATWVFGFRMRTAVVCTRIPAGRKSNFKRPRKAQQNHASNVSREEIDPQLVIYYGNHLLWQRGIRAAVWVDMHRRDNAPLRLHLALNCNFGIKNR